MSDIILNSKNPLYFNVRRFAVAKLKEIGISQFDGLGVKLELLRHGIIFENNEFRLSNEQLSFILLHRTSHLCVD